MGPIADGRFAVGVLEDPPAPEGDALEPGSVAEAALESLRRVASITDVVMRRHALLHQWQSLDDTEVVQAIETVVCRALTKVPAGIAAYDSLFDVGAVTAAWGPNRASTLLEVAVTNQSVGAVQWLRCCQIAERQQHMSGKRTRAPKGREEGQGEAAQVFEGRAQGPLIDPEDLIPRELRELTLGSRRSLARRATGVELERLARDPDPQVVENLMNNTRISESVVLSICSRRPTVSAPLEAVLRSTKWGTRYRIRLSLAQNPHLAVRSGICLLVYLKRRDLESIKNDRTLAPNLRLSAQHFVGLC